MVKKKDSIDYKATNVSDQIYDQYKISVTNMEMFTIDNYQIYAETPSKTNNSLKILNKLSTIIIIHNSIEPSNEHFENIRVEIRTNELKFEVRDVQIEFMIRMLTNINKNNEFLQHHFENEPKPSTKETKQNVVKSQILSENNHVTNLDKNGKFT
jgi:hypothetical protein